jgi:hypothetical protein
MPETTCSRSLDAEPVRVWDYVKDMDNWAHFIMGYQHHEVIDDRRSTWTLKGEAGVLARTVTFDVDIVEWVEPSRVRFTLTGVTERMDGGGEFTVGATQPETPAPPPARVGVFRRWLTALLRRVTRSPAAAPVTPVGIGACTLTFTLSMEAGGMTGPVVNAMIEPLLAVAAEDLAEKVSAEIGRVP